MLGAPGTVCRSSRFSRQGVAQLQAQLLGLLKGRLQLHRITFWFPVDLALQSGTRVHGHIWR